jgi:hypothetical protein
LYQRNTNIPGEAGLQHQTLHLNGSFAGIMGIPHKAPTSDFASFGLLDVDARLNPSGFSISSTHEPKNTNFDGEIALQRLPFASVSPKYGILSTPAKTAYF